MISTPPPMQVVTVQAGQTLGEIAQDHGVSLPAIEASNPSIANPASIYAGENVTIPGENVRSFPVTLTCTATIDASGNLSINDCSTAPKPTGLPIDNPSPTQPNSQPQTPQPEASTVGILPGAEWACIARAESSFNPRSVNAIPGYIGNGGGEYGDLESTWAGYDGYQQPFQAPLSVQNAFNQALQAHDGWSPWLADNCPQKFGNG